ncbi:MAG: GNAT family N-acetyltransferase [Myxococcaceae bacterium]
MAPFIVEPVRKDHERASFRCGSAPLDGFLARYARQNADAGLARTFVAVAPPSLRVVGYYSLAASCIRFATVPDGLRKRLPRYPIPSILLARLATDVTVRGQGLGAALLVDAGQRAARLSAEAGIRFLEVEATDREARGFYLKHGAVALLDDENHLVFDVRVFRAG